MSITLRYKFAEDASLEARVGPTLDITRTTQATMVDADGWIRTVQDGEARFSGAAWSQNISLQSEDFSTTWTTSGVVNTDQAIAPDGSLTADQLIDNAAASGNVAVLVSQSLSVSTSTVYAFSMFAKADQLDWAYIELDNFTTPATNTRAYFDLTDGVVGSTPDAGIDDTGIEDYGNGWYRCWVTFTTDAADTAGLIKFGVSDGDNDNLVADDTTSSIFVWGAQLEDVSGKRQENALLYSEAFDQADWSKTRTTITSGGIAGPDGSTASSLDEDSTAADNHFLRQNVAATLTASVDYTFSIYLKEMNRSWVQLRLINTDADSYRRYFNLNTGALGTATGTGSAGIEDVGDGWYRCSVTMNMSAGIETPQVRVSIAEADNDLIFDGLGQQSVAIYGAQLQEGAVPGIYTVTTDAAVSGAYSPSTYIPTTTKKQGPMYARRVRISVRLGQLVARQA
jgi:hypothetical protein